MENKPSDKSPEDPKNIPTPPPQDDIGINNDYILDLCDYVINTAWEKYIGGSDKKKTPSIEELKNLSETIHTIWQLAQEIIDLDERLMLRDELGDIDIDFFDDDGDEDSDE